MARAFENPFTLEDLVRPRKQSLPQFRPLFINVSFSFKLSATAFCSAMLCRSQHTEYEFRIQKFSSNTFLPVLAARDTHGSRSRTQNNVDRKDLHPEHSTRNGQCYSLNCEVNPTIKSTYCETNQRTFRRARSNSPLRYWARRQNLEARPWIHFLHQ